MVINNSGQSSFAGTIGGEYNFTHCTIANYWNSSFRQFPSVLLNDFALDENGEPAITNALNANFTNCIIYGNDDPELILEDVGSEFNYKFTNCLIRINPNLIGTGNYQINDPTFYEGIVINVDPDFEDPFENLLRIGEDSGANGLALPLMPAGLDILQNNRDTNNPDAGAYESTVFED